MKTGFITFPKELLTRLFCANRPSRALFSLLIILVGCFPLPINAQQSAPLLFHGVILDYDTREPLSGAHFIVEHRSAGAADDRGLISFYAHPHDTVTFSCVGYKEVKMVISDTLFAKEYMTGIFMSTDTLMIAGVIVIPRLGNLRAEIMSRRPLPDNEMVNAANNLKISTYQGLTGANKLGDPATNYELLRQQQKVDAYEKGGIPSDKMFSFSPFTIIPLIYILAKGLPADPKPPEPYMSPKELQQIRTLHDSLVYKKK